MYSISALLIATDKSDLGGLAGNQPRTPNLAALLGESLRGLLPFPDTTLGQVHSDMYATSLFSNLPVGTYAIGYEIMPHIASYGSLRGYKEIAPTSYSPYGFEPVEVKWSSPSVQWDFEIIPFEEATKPKPKKNPNGYRSRQRKNRQAKREDR